MLLVGFPHKLASKKSTPNFNLQWAPRPIPPPPQTTINSHAHSSLLSSCIPTSPFSPPSPTEKPKPVQPNPGSHLKPLKAHPELANPDPTQTKPSPSRAPEILAETQTTEPEGERNKWAVRVLYEALNHRDVDRVHQLLAPDIEWWFHGPPAHQHMMRLLTGAAPDDSFQFVPLSIESIGPTVLVEGSDRSRSALWVHAWTVNPADGIITQVREYFNTSVTVTRVGGKRSATHCLPVWQSKLSDRAGKSLPGLVLAI